MKKTLLVLAIFTGITISAQNAEKTLKANKWYANAAAGEKTIILSKTAPANPAWDAKFDDKGSMNFCSHLTAPILVDGKEIKAGEYYCDSKYTYEVSGNILTIKFPLVDWPYTVKTMPNGDLLLSSTR